MTSLSDYFWKKCILCGYYYRLKRQKSHQSASNLRTSTSLGCLVCNYRDKKDIYYKQLLIDLENKVHVKGEWTKSSDESRVPERLERTLSAAYRELGPIIAEDVFFRAIDAYWYKKYFTLEQNRRS